MESEGHTFVDFNFDQFFEIDRVLREILMAGGLAYDLEKSMKGEKA